MFFKKKRNIIVPITRIKVSSKFSSNFLNRKLLSFSLKYFCIVEKLFINSVDVLICVFLNITSSIGISEIKLSALNKA